MAEWKHSYSRGFAMQASLAMLAFFLGGIAWWKTSILAFLVGALFILAPWPWALLAIMPTLMATDLAKAGPETRALVVKRNRLHAVRTLLAAAAVISFLSAVSARQASVTILLLPPCPRPRR